jgi:hypothetical protein
MEPELIVINSHISLSGLIKVTYGGYTRYLIEQGGYLAGRGQDTGYLTFLIPFNYATRHNFMFLTKINKKPPQISGG